MVSFPTIFREMPVFNTKRLRLKMLSVSDVKAMYEIKSDAVLTARYGREPHKTVNDTMKWMDLVIRSYEQRTALTWGIYMGENQQSIGSVALWNIELESFKAELGYELHRNYWGKGIMTEAIEVILRWVFQETEFNRVEACPMTDNQNSVNLLRKLGFVYEGKLRERIYFGGKFVDQLYFSFLRSDFTKSSFRHTIS